MLSIKGLETNNLIDENEIKYLVFSLTNDKHNLSGLNDGESQVQSSRRDIFYSVSLILQSAGIKDKYENNK